MAAETPAYNGAPTDAASGGLPQLDFSTWAGQIFWLVITFGILYLVLAKFILPRLATGIVDRKDRIHDDLDSAANMQREAEEAEKSYNQTLAAARAKAHNVAETTRSAVDAEIKTEVDAAEADMDRQAAAAEARISELRAKAMSNVEGIASDAAGDIYKALIGKAPTAAQIKAALPKGA